MRIAVAGLWHLGSVTAACCARYFQVVGLDFEGEIVAALLKGTAPLFEPGLDELLTTSLKKASLSFTSEASVACRDVNLLWLTYDTPVNDSDECDVNYVLEKLRRCLLYLPQSAVVLISSQVPVGTCAQLEKEYPQFRFAYSPENLRVGRAINAFENPERIIVGIRDEGSKRILEELFAPFTGNIIWMRTESAEMVKHGLNSFLALSIAFINEIARLCERVGADAAEVSQGLKSDMRIGPKAYFGPGAAFAGGTLARDVVALTKLGLAGRETLFLIPAIKQSNDVHAGWSLRKLESRLGSIRRKQITVLGLTYTPNTSTLRRSLAVDLLRLLLKADASLRAYDPAAKSLPPDLIGVQLAERLFDAVADCEAIVVCTEWPEFRQAEWPLLIRSMRRRLVIDANGFLEKELKGLPNIEHLSVGRV